MMLLRFDPFRELDRLVPDTLGTIHRPAIPVDAYRDGDELAVHVDLPGVDPADIDLTVERDVLTVTAERTWEHDDADILVSERPQGRFTRRLWLGEDVDADGIAASYDDGVLTVRLPVSEAARPRRVEVTSGHRADAIEATSTDTSAAAA